jgi:mono/diheme cytochrome c family protein
VTEQRHPRPAFPCFAFILLGCVGCAVGRQEASVPHADVGTTLFESYCAGCHIDASGPRGENPPLEGASWVVGPEQRLIKIVLHGVRGPIEVNGNTYNLHMPPHGHLLTDAQIASLAWYVRRRFGGAETPIRPHTVRAIRAAHAARTAPWTAHELLEDP